MLTGKVALVTGATGGLGPAVVRALADAGVAIGAAARKQASLDALRAEVGLADTRWLAQTSDLTDPIATQAVVEAVVAHFGSLDILVAVTGGWRGGSNVADTDLATLDWLWRVNLVTAFNTMRAVLPQMCARGWGRIITIGARSAIGGQVRSGAYAASKAALLALTQSVAAETRKQGITANTVVLSTVDTPANRSAMPDVDPSRWVAPEQIAATIRFLCSDQAAAISGAAIPVYGQA